MQVMSSFCRYVLVAFAFLAGSPAVAQDALQAVRELYASAAYEDALSAIEKMDGVATLEAEEYRASCLLALGKAEEADKTIETVLIAQPEYRPDPAQASPRIQALFSQVRRRIGPSLVKRTYQRGRAAMDQKNREEAIAQFESMLRLADDPDVRTDSSVTEMKDLGSGFLHLSRALPARPPSPAAPATATAEARPSSVLPPVVIQQRLPQWLPDPSRRATEFSGAVRVQISADGKVTSAEIIKSVHYAYDQLLVRAARTWTYEPAQRDGAPVPSEKTVEIQVLPAGKTAERTGRSQTF